MGLNDIARHVLETWTTVREAPSAIITAAALIALVLFSVFQWRYSSQFESFEQRIKLKDDTIASYKVKLDGASPDEARARIDRLEARLNAYRPSPDDILKALKDGRITPTADGGFRKLDD